jgi:hypothetical protein
METRLLLDELERIGALGGLVEEARAPRRVVESVDEVQVERAKPGTQLKDARGPRMVQQLDSAILHLEALLEIFHEMRATWVTGETPRIEAKPAEQPQTPADLVPPSQPPTQLLPPPIEDPKYEAARANALAKIRGEAHMIPEPEVAQAMKRTAQSTMERGEIPASSPANRARPADPSEFVSVGSMGARKADA